MSAVLTRRTVVPAPAAAHAGQATARPATARPATAGPPRLALLGTGTVGRAFVARCEQLRARGHAVPAFAWLANSRAWRAPANVEEAGAVLATLAGVDRDTRRPALDDGLVRGDLVVDATASDTVAEAHAGWLARGIHVVTANKLGGGGPLRRATAIAQATARGGRYGDSATVGAGLPLLHCVRALVAGGDRIHAIEGLLSGSLGWLFDHFDGARPFSALVAAAMAEGLTEPDPRCDLSGQDVRRKLLILARAAGQALHPADIAVESLVTPGLAAARPGDVVALLPCLDAGLAVRARAASAAGDALRMVGRFEAGGDSSVALRALPPGHALRGGHGSDNRVAIWSDRYRDQPLVIQGPGAGAAVTAAALLDDVLALGR